VILAATILYAFRALTPRAESDEREPVPAEV
jgi:hypothetical protein